MKRNLSLFLFTAALLLAACSGGPKAVSMPPDTDLEFWVTEDVSDVDFSGYEEVTGWMGARQFYGSGYHHPLRDDGYPMPEDPPACVKYLVTAWPDYADGGVFVTEIEVTDPAVRLCGLTTGATPEEFWQTFSGLGWRVSREDGRCTAGRDGVTVVFRCPDAGERAFTVSVEVTNREGLARRQHLLFPKQGPS